MRGWRWIVGGLILIMRPQKGARKTTKSKEDRVELSFEKQLGATIKNCLRSVIHAYA